MSSIMTIDGWYLLEPAKMYKPPEQEYALRPWDEKYDRNLDPRFAPKQLPPPKGDHL